uniref:peptidylprolyl isomerase n=1 Tax=Octactis speculum TaxID=3111310 RepID=A0A7S2AST5_9STRA|mmetsp:Transcript_15087/g.20217  ORF Transcript_15087/g.20217 Transcript_15087/m.20217 type:complete len:211 (+) Transcript_15087:144-776(+)|eukprot:CAMPEP_0185746224 /NCGR_PEP_ID=MMETSP1174-20130828/4715_1 /TAXON_ID=35687 /ORGANISM="Dictyocha speculum, Strain CCMP1381" /LENGTH=210 /DNA_ID=CAMNT_0028420731 /DNA_START=144 /DNA_END=776 /DNA_ORIENTATION=+
MIQAHSILLLILATVGTGAANELSVTVYDGPTDCDESEKSMNGAYLKMHYTGTIDASSKTGEAGKQFDSSRTRGKTFDFQLGAGKVIQGWDKGLVGICKGAKAILVIPPEMGYGERGAGGDIPGGATLNFDVEVVDFSMEAPEEPNLFDELDLNKDGFLSEEEMLIFFKKQGKDELPPGLMDHEDKDADGKISWVEFSGPKGTKKPNDEL